MALNVRPLRFSNSVVVIRRLLSLTDSARCWGAGSAMRFANGRRMSAGGTLLRCLLASLEPDRHSGGGSTQPPVRCAQSARRSVSTSIFGGPIVITGASGHVGGALRRRLAAGPSEIRALTRHGVTRQAFRDAQAVVHLAGTLLPGRQSSYAQANRTTVSETVAALRGSSVERVVFLSYGGADPHTNNAYLRAKGEAEELLYRSGHDCVVFRCTHIFGPADDPGPTIGALIARRGHSVWVLGDGCQRVAPVYREDVVDAIVAALDPSTYHGRFDLPAPRR